MEPRRNEPGLSGRASATSPVRLSFFNEQDPPELTALSSNRAALTDLMKLRARVTMGLRDLSVERAAAVHRFADAGVPVDAWLLLPKERGYFATHDNAEFVEARVDEALAWIDAHRLPITSLGFDFEPDLRELDGLFASPVRTLGAWAVRSFDRVRRERALERYTSLISRVQARGLRVEAYQFPLLLEDRAVGSRFFQRFASALDVPVQREVVMAYTSLLGPLGPGLLERWSQHAPAIAVGSTGGGVDPLPKLSFDELSRDLRLAARHCRDVSIFSLEGCVQQRWLERLVDFDWDAKVELPVTQRFGASAAGALARGLARVLR